MITLDLLTVVFLSISVMLLAAANIIQGRRLRALEKRVFPKPGGLKAWRSKLEFARDQNIYGDIRLIPFGYAMRADGKPPANWERVPWLDEPVDSEES